MKHYFSVIILVLQDVINVSNALIDLVNGNATIDNVKTAYNKLLQDAAPLITLQGLIFQCQSLLFTFSDPILNYSYTFAVGNPLLSAILDFIFGPTSE